MNLNISIHIGLKVTQNFVFKARVRMRNKKEKIYVIGFVEKCAQMSHFWAIFFFFMKLTSQIREMWIGIICIIGQMRILDGWELYHFNIRGPLIVGAALSAMTSLVHIFLKVAWLCNLSLSFNFSTISIIFVTRMTLYCRSLNSS